MSLPNEPRHRKRLSRNDSEVDPPRLSGLSPDEFCDAADTLIGNGLHPIAIGKANPNKPDRPAGKAPWHSGVTGYNGEDADADQVMTWAANVASRIERGESGVLNIGMRMPVGGLGLDVDAYDGKCGLLTVAEHEARFGALPPTFRVTARAYAEGSGIRLYRVPDDWYGATILKTEDGADGNVELIQRFHRLAAVPPSHHHIGARYKVYDETNDQEVVGGSVPRLEDWPKLPDAWVEGLRRAPAKAAGGEATDEQVERFAAEYTRSEQPWHLTEYVVPSVRAADGTRNAARDALYEAARTARVGWCSWSEAVAEIESAARDRYAERGERFDPSDFARSVSVAVCAAMAESLPELEERSAKRLADEEAKRRAAAGVDGWAPTIVNETSDANDGSPTWAPVDVRAARDSRSALLPTILKRSDGPCLFYRGRIHSVHGETESGKSWLVQCATAECLLIGEPVLYLDFEDEAGAVAERLVRLGVPAEVVENPTLFIYVHPEAPPTTERERRAFDALLADTYSLAVVDGVTDSMALFGLSGMDADDVARWHRELPKAIAFKTGAAVACVDHVAKDSQTRGRFALGSQHKIAGLSGAAYVVEMEQPFAVGQAGRASVRVGKDRPGRVRGLGGRWRKSDRTQHVADLLLDSTDAERTLWALDPPSHGGASADTDNGKPSKATFRPTWFMEQVSRYWEETEDATERTNTKTIKAMCEERKSQDKPQHRQHWREAIKVLEAEEFASSNEGARESIVYTVVKPYRQLDDPLSDEYAEGAGRDVDNWKVQLPSDQEGGEK